MQNGLLQLNGVRVKTSIDDLELLGDLGNGTCGHVVKMRHRNSGQEIAVKQVRYRRPGGKVQRATKAYICFHRDSP